MEPTLALQAPTTREDSSTYATDDPLDLQGLWPITSDFTNAARRVATSFSSVARSLAQDNDAATSSLRQMLLEIRARLVYIFSNIRAFVVANTSHLIHITATIVAAHLQNDAHADSPSDLAYLVTMILDNCSNSNLLLIDTIRASETFFVSFQQYQSRARSVHPRSVSSILHSIGTLVSPIASPSTPPPPEQQKNLITDSIRHDLEQMNVSLDRIEAFWRKRQNLYSGSGYTFGREQMLRFHRSCNQLGIPYLHFVDPLNDGQHDLCRAQPSINVSPETLSEDAKLQLSWRSLLS